MTRDELVSALVNLGFNVDALKALSDKSLAIVWACHKTK